MSRFISWKAMKDTDGICNIDLEEVIEKLGGDGITLSQARRACKEGIFYFPNAVRAATALELPNWEKALGKAVAHVHPKAKDYYEDEEAYLHNQKALEEGRLEDVDRAAARAAANAAGAAEADWATWAAAATKAAWDAAEAAAATWTAWAAAVAVDDVNDLIDIYFDVLEEA